jgi:hypothetical protein
MRCAVTALPCTRRLAIYPLDADLPLRMAAAEHLWALLNGAPRPPPLTRDQRRRIARGLLASDVRVSGGAYRHVAELLFGPARVSAEAWKTSALRAQAIRLVKAGRQLIQSGYQALLRLTSRRR